MNKTNIIGPLPVAQPGKPMQPSAHSATSRIKWAVALRMPKPLPLGEPFGYTSTPFYHTFPLATRLNGRKNSQNGQKSRKNACKALCRRPSEPKNTGGKTPESPKIPLQLGCSVTQIRHFFKRTFFNLPLIFENNVKKATVWLHQGGKTSPSMLRIATARVAAPSVCYAVACILLAAAPTAPPCFRHWRRSSPLLLPRGGLGIPQGFISSPEAPLLGELSGASPTERLDEGRPALKERA